MRLLYKDNSNPGFIVKTDHCAPIGRCLLRLIGSDSDFRVWFHKHWSSLEGLFAEAWAILCCRNDLPSVPGFKLTKDARPAKPSILRQRSGGCPLGLFLV